MSEPTVDTRLLEHHLRALAASGLSPEEATAAGIRSVTAKEAARLTGLEVTSGGYVIPYPGTDAFRIRLDVPHRFPGGREAKYLAPVGSVNRLYVPEVCRKGLSGDPARRVVVVEGEKKALSVALRTEELVIGISGVWNWRSRTGPDGIVQDLVDLLPLLRGRGIDLGFDSDARSNVEVCRAAWALAEWLTENARATVRWAFPTPAADGSKRGFDDLIVGEGPDAARRVLDTAVAPVDPAAFVLRERVRRVGPDEKRDFAGSALFRELADLLHQAPRSLRPALAEEIRRELGLSPSHRAALVAASSAGRAGAVESEEYVETPDGLVWRKPTQDGFVDLPLTNFAARIVAETVVDDGAEVSRRFEIEATLRGRTARFAVAAAAFPAMSWVAEQLGADAILYPGIAVKDHARAAIQVLSREIEHRQVFAHTGWRCIDGKWIYLHADGAIGARGAVPDLEVALPEPLSPAALPAPPSGEALSQAIRTSLRIADLAPDRVTLPLLCGVYRAVLGHVDLSEHLSGPTGVGKTELAALGQQHYGAAFDARRLPSGWSSTGNALEELAFVAKDMILTVDDFVAQGTRQDQSRLHREAERIFRAAGNRSGRQRLRSDATLRPVRPPRCMVVSTGEDLPAGRSLRARMAILELGPKDLDWKALTELQAAGRAGAFAQAMAGYVMWIASRYEEIRAGLRQETEELRDRLREPGAHRRTSDALASLLVGFRRFLEYAVSSGALTEAERVAWETRATAALADLGRAQARHLEAEEPARLFVRLLGSVLASGKAHVATAEGLRPECPGLWGWRESSVVGECSPQGSRIGWLAGDGLCLNFDAAFAEVQTLAGRTGEIIPVSAQTLRKRLKEADFLAAYDPERSDVKRVVDGVRQRVLVLKRSLLCAEPGQPGREGQDGPVTDGDTPDRAPPARPGFEPDAAESGREPGRPDRASTGPNGPALPDSGCLEAGPDASSAEEVEV